MSRGEISKSDRDCTMVVTLTSVSCHMKTITWNLLGHIKSVKPQQGSFVDLLLRAQAPPNLLLETAFHLALGLLLSPAVLSV